MITNFHCHFCGTTDPHQAKKYDGALGYEAIVCKNCGAYCDSEKQHNPNDWSLQVVGLKKGEKRFSVMHNVGKTKYLVNYHNGLKRHRDGSDFFDIRTFTNKEALRGFERELIKNGYRQL